MQTTSQLTFTRFIAAFMIVIYHFAPPTLIPKINFLQELSAHLNLGVSYFYLLSGFVMILAYGKKKKIKTSNFWLNRIARIYPLHILTLISSILVYIIISINYLEYIKIPLDSLAINALLIHSWIPSISLSFNIPSWSISVELFFYFLFPFMFNYIYKKKTFKKTTIYIYFFFGQYLNYL